MNIGFFQFGIFDPGSLVNLVLGSPSRVLHHFLISFEFYRVLDPSYVCFLLDYITIYAYVTVSCRITNDLKGHLYVLST
jgi:hypothetical protein